MCQLHSCCCKGSKRGSDELCCPKLFLSCDLGGICQFVHPKWCIISNMISISVYHLHKSGVNSRYKVHNVAMGPGPQNSWLRSDEAKMCLCWTHIYTWTALHINSTIKGHPFVHSGFYYIYIYTKIYIYIYTYKQKWHGDIEKVHIVHIHHFRNMIGVVVCLPLAVAVVTAGFIWGTAVCDASASFRERDRVGRLVT